ncbi:hypothetical protein [Legionella bononiensis]|uniref:MSHA biogenesis protein MshJ n=1 Tax=Legionella bononiensis TaxID=2793102 RepID=A0ABS1WBD9_9GAMM|nr:hypothetical protein [Legionella bononiensis]MBL7480965.1 hypothetical protein [Legionella bononiensis]MBL7526673.1 hypothetical protein [Legionella bononiensis]MBL7564080.1 hypothetical protein [Legionella bononiensis]
MSIHLLFLRHYQLFKLRIEQLSERDRFSLLIIVLSLLFGLWFLAVHYPQKKAINDSVLQTQQLETQVNELKQKQTVIHILLNNPDTVQFLNDYKDLMSQLNEIEKKFARYRRRYISSRDLAKLLHDMLKQTFGVTIVDLATIPQPAVIQPQPTTNQVSSGDASSNQKASNRMNVVHTHYRLILKGNYFPIMNYLKRLEGLNWSLYWDKFTYTVKKYPEGIAEIEFYTLKLPTDTTNVAQGVTP